MKKLLFLIFIFSKLFASNLERGISLYNQNKYDEALDALIKVPPKSDGFKRSLEIQSIIYYKQENYQKLIVTSLFYRKHFLSDNNFNAKILGLELLTLNKMCQYDAVTNILSSIKKQKSLDLTELEKNLEIGRNFSVTSELAPEDKFSKRDLWKVNEEMLLKLKSPYELVIKLENKCRG